MNLNSSQGNDDVISINGSLMKVEQIKKISEKVFRDNLTEAITHALKAAGMNVDLGGEWDDNNQWVRYTSQRWLDGGIDGEMLQVGAPKWLQGKISLKVSLEFDPKEPKLENSIELPLGEISSTLEEESFEESIEPESAIEVSLDEIQLATEEESVEPESAIEFPLDQIQLTTEEESIEPESAIEFPLDQIQPTLNGATFR